MRSLLLLGLLGAANINGHPTDHKTKSGLRRRTVDLNAYRLKATAKYSSAADTVNNPTTQIIKRESYVDTAVELVKSVVPGAEFRVVEDHYVGTNGIAHVHFKQTVHGLDIDNADFNVNVCDFFSYYAARC
jgi:extracellular elastinolytic metalloproteinase